MAGMFKCSKCGKGFDKKTGSSLSCPDCRNAYQRERYAAMHDMKPRHTLSSFDPEQRTGVCAICGPTRIRKKGKSGTGWRCSQSGPSTKEKRRADAKAKFPGHDGKCDLCGAEETMHADHCHATGVIRGFLCRACNVGLGHFKDDPELMRRAAEYIERYR